MNKSVAGCHRVEPLLLRHLHDELTPAQARTVTAHLQICAACRERLGSFRAIQADLREMRKSRLPPAPAAARDRPRAPPSPDGTQSSNSSNGAPGKWRARRRSCSGRRRARRP
jgi:anti-sigma factor RsiW